MCLNTLNGLADNGLMNSMLTILERIRNRNHNTLDLSLEITLRIYFEENIISLLHYRMLAKIVSIFSALSESSLQSLSLQLAMFYIASSVVNLVAYIGIFVFLQVKFLRKFSALRRGLLLIPVERAAEDANILSMIKSSLQIKL